MEVSLELPYRKLFLLPKNKNGLDLKKICALSLEKLQCHNGDETGGNKGVAFSKKRLLSIVGRNY